MAWQNSTAMGNGGGPGSAAEGGNNGGQSHGTEYTLQGTNDTFPHHRHIMEHFQWTASSLLPC